MGRYVVQMGKFGSITKKLSFEKNIVSFPLPYQTSISKSEQDPPLAGVARGC